MSGFSWYPFWRWSFDLPHHLSQPVSLFFQRCVCKSCQWRFSLRLFQVILDCPYRRKLGDIRFSHSILSLFVSWREQISKLFSDNVYSISSPVFAVTSDVPGSGNELLLYIYWVIQRAPISASSHHNSLMLKNFFAIFTFIFSNYYQWWKALSCQWKKGA